MQNVVSKNLLLQQIFLRFMLDPRSQISRLGVFSMNEHAMLQLAVNTLGYTSNKMWSIKQNFNNISKCSWPSVASKFGQKQYFGDHTVSIIRVNLIYLYVCLSPPIQHLLLIGSPVSYMMVSSLSPLPLFV